MSQDNITSVRSLPHVLPALSRREFLTRAGAGFGTLALAFLMAQEAEAQTKRQAVSNPLAPKPPMFPARARSVIFLFMFGGPSQVDTFDPKPELDKHHGQTVSSVLPDVKEIPTFFGEKNAALMKSPFPFKKYGQSGIEVSELYPHVGSCVDDLCVVRSLYSDSNNHAPAAFQMNTGAILPGHPALGAWLTYGLGTENQNLPAFVVLLDSVGAPIGGAPNWSAGFMPAAYQGTVLRSQGTPILDLYPDAKMGTGRERTTLDLLQKMNQRHLSDHPGNSELEARIAAYELAYRMQTSAPEALDIGKESEETKKLYGLDRPETEDFGRKCLLARRMVERGVRFVQIYSGGVGAGPSWDAHSDLVGNHRHYAGATDKPIAGLLQDLKRHGLLDSTLVVWGGEFGRMPISQGGSGRDHNPGAQTVWMAGGGVKGGTVVGSSDEIGYKAASSPYHVRDLHATILHCMGLNDISLTYLYNGRYQRLTDNGGQLIKEALA